MTSDAATPAPTFSVIVTTFNRATWLREAVESVLVQDADLECVVVDDGGTVELDLPSDARVRVVTHPRNLGLPTALNTGLDACRGEYVTYLDDDDRLARGRLSMTLDALEQADLVFCWHGMLDGRPRPEWNLEWEDDIYDTVLDTWAPSKGAIVMRRAIVPRFDPRYVALEDLEWLLRLTRNRRATTVAEVGYLIREHGGERNLNGPLARVRFGEMLLAERSDYFSTHRRAAAFRWYMLGCLGLQLGDRAYARRAFLRSLSLRAEPRRIRNLVAAARRSTYRIPDEMLSRPS